MSSFEALAGDLRAALGESDLVTEPEELAYYGQDRCRGGWPVAPSAIAFPRDIGQVQALVRACAHHGVAIVPSGGRTGLAGAATATRGELVVSFDRFNRRCEVEAPAKLVHCDPGVTIARVHEAAAACGLRYPVDWAASGTAQVGGSIATNAGGIRVLRYGSTRAWVRDLELVLADGRHLRLAGNVLKDNTGYDLRQLFIASEGTLGLIVGASLGLVSPPADRLVVAGGVGGMPQMLALFERLRAGLSTLSAFECFDGGCVEHVVAHRGQGAQRPMAEDHAQYVVLEVEIERAGEGAKEAMTDQLMELLADAQEAGELDDAVLAASDQQARALWAWREDISESLHPHTPHKADVCVPVHRIAVFEAAWRDALASQLEGIEARCFGHVGDGNLHLNLLRPAAMSLEDFLARCHAFDDTLYRLVCAHEGSVSAEHGVGLLKRRALEIQREGGQLDAMRAIKAALDPGGLFNPGKIFT